MNTAIISGRLVRDPGYNETQNEKGLHKIAKFVLAVRRNYSDDVSFIPVKAFAKKAEFVRDYLVQGTKVMVEGEIVTGSYDNKETGKKVYTTELFADRIEFAGAKVLKLILKAKCFAKKVKFNCSKNVINLKIVKIFVSLSS